MPDPIDFKEAHARAALDKMQKRINEDAELKVMRAEMARSNPQSNP